MNQDNFYASTYFWRKVSNYSILISGIALILKMYFRKYIEDIIWPVLLVGIIAFFVFALAELLLYLNKREK
jgi:hypothetical protein